ncbi:MAG: hypothetical protein AAF847_11385 [Bacteroidota bacterium]
MSSWQSINKIALLGVDRAPIPSEILEELEQLGAAVASHTDTQNVLEAAAYHAQLQKITLPIEEVKGQLPPKARIAPYEVKYISTRSTQHFQEILQQRSLALQEFSLHAQDQALFLLPELLPSALETVRANLKNWNYIAPLMEENGWWLLNKNPHWTSLKDRPYRRIAIPANRVAQATRGIQDFQIALANGRTYLDQSDGSRLMRWAYYANLEAYDRLRNDWSPDILGHPMWQGRLHQLFDTLKFRQEMCRALEETSGQL